MMHRVITGPRLAVVVAAVTALGAGACERELRRFDLEVALREAESVAGVVDDGSVDLLTRLFADGDEVNGGADRNQVVDVAVADRPAIDDDTETVRLEVEARDRDFNLLALGSSTTLAVPALGETLNVEILLAPESPDLLTSLPPSLGGDACMADDGVGGVFLMGGSSSTQGGYFLEDSTFPNGFTADFPIGVGGIGCAAANIDGQAVVAVVGGCVGAASGEIAIISDDGDRSSIDASAILGVNRCGAAAAPRRAGAAWLIAANNSIHAFSADGGNRGIGVARAGDRQGIEVTAKGNLVTIIDSDLVYADDDGTTDLGIAIALGRRGADVLAIDSDGVVSAVEDATTRPLGVSVDGAFVHFVVLDDDTFVGLGSDGRTITVEGPGGARTFTTKSGGHTRVSALPGGAVVIHGSAAAGMEVMAPPRTP